MCFGVFPKWEVESLSQQVKRWKNICGKYCNIINNIRGKYFLEPPCRMMGATVVEIVKQHHWNDYFPRLNNFLPLPLQLLSQRCFCILPLRWSPEDMKEAKLWKLLEIQGNKRTWLIGGQVWDWLGQVGQVWDERSCHVKACMVKYELIFSLS